MDTEDVVVHRPPQRTAWLREHGYLVEEIDADGVRAQLITPPGALEQGTLVAFHGGGFIVCSAATHAKAFTERGGVDQLTQDGSF